MDADDLNTQLYEALRGKARRLVAHTNGEMAPTSLVHEVVAKLWRHDPERWQSEMHFRATASRAMRQVLIDRARARSSQKRGGHLSRVTLTGLGEASRVVDIVSLDQALARLEDADPATAEIVTLRLLGGLQVEEVASLLSLSPSTVKRAWRAGRAFLMAALGGA